MQYLLVTLAALVILGTLLASLRSDNWWMRIFDFPRLQLGALGFAVLLAYAALYRVDSRGEAALLLLLGGAVAYQAYRMFWYTPLAPVQALAARRDDTEGLRLMIANVLMSNRRAAGLLASIEREAPDVLLVVEADAWWEEQLRGLAGAYPFNLRHPLPNTYGMLLFSRRRLAELTLRFLVQEDVPSIRARLELGEGRSARLYCVHPRPPRPLRRQDSTWRDAELLRVAREIRGGEGPALVLGDLNDVAWSHTTRLFQRVSRLLDPRVGRGFYNTYHAEHRALRYPLDHVFFSPDFRLRRITRLPAFGSDHFPILVELGFEPQGRARHGAPAMDGSDRRESRARIRKAEVTTDPMREAD